ncbi:hypothetical protein DEDE109153_05270 [Deinococcus deserti]|uniref:Uncharacterized protein n=1 Tax=Deinococcus deserti (strain DSM 17065 / CIP 109153 / LMG 22923 / VCD115) TaxID=546414 RepID=C1D1C6_DEIDV|nr:hypothetical protein [Deinococcus deserti]ACO45650.1 Conserved hypothetical protein; putative membrane protein [Deinococcus deserti VCD115]
MTAAQLSLITTGALLGGLLLLGLSLQLGWRRNQARWPHHALFFAVCLGTGCSLMLTIHAGLQGWALAPALILLLTMPRTRPGSASHWQRAVLVALAYTVGAWISW